MFLLRKLIISVWYIFEFLLHRKSLVYYQTKIKIPSDLDPRTRLQFFLRKYEDDEISCILNHFKDASNVVEVGGGCGVLSAVLDKQLELESHAVYEAIDVNYERIVLQPLNPNTKVFNFAVVADDDVSILKFRKRGRIFGSGFKKNNQNDDILDEYIDVPCVKTSEVIKKNTDLVIMDVEGYESDLLPNITSLSDASVVFEYHADKCSLTIGELINLCPTHNIQHYRHSTFFAISNSKS